MFRQGRLRTAEEAAGRPPGAETQYKLQCKIRYRLQYKWQYKIQYNLQYRVQYNIPCQFRAPLVSLVPSLWVSLVSLASCLHLHGSQRSTAEVSSRAAMCPIRKKKFFCGADRGFCTHFLPPTSFAGSRPRCQMRWQASRCFTISFQQKKNRQLSAP